MHDLYVSDVKDLQKAMFRKESLPEVVMNPQDANQATFAVTWSWCAYGCRRADCCRRALPYPPGVLCVVP
jgi:ornithine decarboxylase